MLINTSPAFISSDIMELLTKWGTPFFGSLAMIIPMGVVPLVSIITRSYSAEHISRIYNEKESAVA